MYIDIIFDILNSIMIYTFVPLGNPGSKYEHTRHNVARIVFSCIEEELSRIASLEVFVPSTFMNESGKAVSEYLRYHDGREVVIVYDDKDLPLGKIRISHDRGDGGHNGVKSVIASLGTEAFTRIRIGIANITKENGERVHLHGDMVSGYVLAQFSDEEMHVLKSEVKEKVLGAVTSLVNDGYVKAMEKWNGV